MTPTSEGALLVHSLVVGTAVTLVKGLGGKQTFWRFFTAGDRPLGQEQTVLPFFKEDVKVSGQAHVAVNGLEE